MPTNYLLPCACGKKTNVEANQAGLTVRCECGTELAVPAMRGLAGLERVEASRPIESAPSAAVWGPRQGLTFLGGAIVLGAALAAVGLWLSIPAAPSLTENYQQQSREMIGKLPPDILIEAWNEYRKGIEQELWERRIDDYEAVVQQHMQFEMVAGGVGCLGLLLAIVGLVLPQSPHRTHDEG